MSEHRLSLESETDNKLRWNGDVSGVAFKLYVPKSVVPDALPREIHVSVESGQAVREPNYARRDARGLRATVELVSEHTETIRYRRVGDAKEWIIGEPYIPKSLLPAPWPEKVGLVVRWN